jgi:hypothetical protein
LNCLRKFRAACERSQLSVFQCDEFTTPVVPN